MARRGKEHLLSEQSAYEKALGNPAASFGSPEAVVDTPDLSKQEKIEILRRWEYDARELDAEEEESPEGHSERNLLQRIHQALHDLETSLGFEIESDRTFIAVDREEIS